MTNPKVRELLDTIVERLDILEARLDRLDRPQPSNYIGPYVYLSKYGDNMPFYVQRAKGLNGKLVVVGNKDGASYTYMADELCLFDYPNIKLNRIVSEHGWNNPNKPHNGILCIECEDRDDYWTACDDKLEDDTFYTPNYEGRLEIFIKELLDLNLGMPYIHSDDIKNVIDRISEDVIPDKLL